MICIQLFLYTIIFVYVWGSAQSVVFCKYVSRFYVEQQDPCARCSCLIKGLCDPPTPPSPDCVPISLYLDLACKERYFFFSCDCKPLSEESVFCMQIIPGYSETWQVLFTIGTAKFTSFFTSLQFKSLLCT